jgi:hypothetical protein
MALPISTKAPYRYCFQEEQLRDARKALEDLCAEISALESLGENADAGTIAEKRAALEAAEKAVASAEEAVAAKPPAWLIRVPTRRDRIEFECALIEDGLRFDSDREFLRVMRDGIRAVVEEGQAGELLAMVDELEAIPLPRSDVPQDLLEAVDLVARTLRERYQRFAKAEASRARYLALAPIAAAAMFLVGRDGEKPLRRQGTGPRSVVAAEEIEKIPDTDLALIGWKAIALMRPTETELGN